MNEDIRKDISWFVKFLPVSNSNTRYNHGDIAFAHTLTIDACLQGVGGVCNENVHCICQYFTKFYKRQRTTKYH